LFEERCGVGIEEAGEPSQGVGGAVGAMVVVPARHFALVLVATHVRGDAYDGLMDVAVAETATSVTRAVLDGVVGSQFEAFVTECWLTDRGRFIRVVEGDPIFVRGTLGSSDDRHSSLSGRGTGGRLRVDVVEDASGEPRMNEAATGLEQCVVVHPYVLF